MRDEGFADRFELDLRDALRLELAGVRVGVAAPQVRGRIAARQRARRTTQLLLLAVALAIAALGGLVLAGRIAPPPAGAEPATVAAIDAESGDLVMSRAWPDGRTEEGARYPGALDLLRGVIGFTTATGLPDDAVATAGNGGRLAIALPSGDVLVWASSNGETPSGRVADRFTTAGWLGWTPDGRLASVGQAYARLFDPVAGDETAVALPAGVHPDWTTGEGRQLMAWTGDGKIVAERSDTEVGALDLAVDPPAFLPGLPAAVRADTGREQRYAADGSWPGSGCQDDRLVLRCAGLAEWSSHQAITPTATWYVARANQALHPVPARTADGRGLLLVARATDADRGSVLLVDAPGTWREAFEFDSPRLDTANLETQVEGWSTLVGVAPGGRSVALRTPAALLVGDLATGATSALPAGTVFVGWPTAPTVETDRLARLPSCEPATAGDAASVSVIAAGVISPASSGAQPVVGERQDADPFRRAGLASAPVIEAEPGGFLALALPSGTCAEAATSSAVPIAGAPDDQPVELGVWSAGHGGTVAGLLPLVAPPPGDWVVRVELRLAGADREAILLYHVRTVAP